MRVRSLHISAFRGIESLRLDFAPDQKTTVLAGVNGVGKTSVLDCLAILLSRLVGRIRSTSGTGRFFTESDITNWSNETRNEITIKLNGKDATWAVTKTRGGRKQQTITHLSEVKAVVEGIQDRLGRQPAPNLPLAVYYPVNRAVLQIPLRTRRRRSFEQLEAYDQAMVGGRNDFGTFFEWFRNREDLENEKRLRSRRHRDRQLEAVRKAVYALIPGFSDLRVERSPLRMMACKDGREVTVNQLSDGEKCLLAMTGDLARRLAILNPALPDPLAGAGVALIDEIELHLYPGWQRQVIPALQHTFPQCQFIVTTHSPQILSHVKPQGVYLLRYEDCVLEGDKDETHRTITAQHPESSYGMETNRILGDLMGVPERPQEIKDRIHRLYQAIDEHRFPEAEKMRERLGEEIGMDDPELVTVGEIIRRMKILGR